MQAASAQQTLLEEAQALAKLHTDQLSCVGPAQQISGLQETLNAAAAPAPACAPNRMSAVQALNRVRLGSLFACVCAWLLPLLA